LRTVPARKFQFDGFTLDLGTRQLLEGSAVIHLSSKAIDLLAVLLLRRPQVASKKELHEHLWPDTFVVEGNLSGLIAELRRALRDDVHNARFIRTVHRHGYAFCGVAQEVSERSGSGVVPAFSHWITWEAGQAVLSEGQNIIGRGRHVTLWLDSPTISRRHARIVVTGSIATLEDIGSRNGSYLRGEPVQAPVRLSDGDDIRLGSILLTYRLNSGQQTTVIGENQGNLRNATDPRDQPSRVRRRSRSR